MAHIEEIRALSAGFQGELAEAQHLTAQGKLDEFTLVVVHKGSLRQGGSRQFAQQQALRPAATVMVQPGAVMEIGAQVDAYRDSVAGIDGQGQLTCCRVSCADIGKQGAQCPRTESLPLPASIDEKAAQAEGGYRQIVAGDAACVRIDTVITHGLAGAADRHRFGVRAGRCVRQQVGDVTDVAMLCRKHSQCQHRRSQPIVDGEDANVAGRGHLHLHWQ